MASTKNIVKTFVQSGSKGENERERKIKMLVVASPVNVVGPCGNASSFFMNTHGCSSAVLHQCCAQSPSTNFIDWSPLDKWSPNEKCQLSALITKQQKVSHHLVKPYSIHLSLSLVSVFVIKVQISLWHILNMFCLQMYFLKG